MPVLLSILGALAAAAFFYYRIRTASRLTDEAVRAIEDPALAAAALLIALASRRGPMGSAAQSAIRNEMRDVMAMPKVEEAFNYARRVAGQVKDPNELVGRFLRLWMDRLRPSERAELYDMASRVAEANGGLTDEQAGCLRLLSEGLGLTRPRSLPFHGSRSDRWSETTHDMVRIEVEMRRHGFALAATLCAALALGACTSTRFGGAPVQSATAAPILDPEPIEPVPSGPIEAAPLAPIEGQPLPPPGMTPPSGGTDIAALPPAAPPPAAPASRTSMVGAWTARDASGGSCRIQLSSSPALDLYRASASGCSNQDLSRVNAWDYRDGEVYLYQTGGAVAARLRGSSSALSGAIAKSGAPLSLAR